MYKNLFLNTLEKGINIMQIKLEKATIYKYKSIENEQVFEVEPDVTVLVGMNEAGKTNLLEALAKVRYFEDDKDFEYNLTLDYPRKQKKTIDRSGEDPIAVKLTYSVSKDYEAKIQNSLNLKYNISSFSYSKKYGGNGNYDLPNLIFEEGVKALLNKIGVDDEEIKEQLVQIKSKESFDKMIISLKAEKDEDTITKIQSISKYFVNSWNWDNPISEYIARIFLQAKTPKFMYYDDYYTLPSRINLKGLESKEALESEEKTAKALLELADLDLDNVIGADSYEDFKAELEATQASITEELFNYWKTNQNLRIQFDVDKVDNTDRNGTHIVDYILDLRVQNLKTAVSLPLKNRSKGFNWFFSFLVWFKKIQADTSNSYILLLDEPGLNLHALAQADLLKFIEDLSENYQIIYTTHSPFMIDSSKLHRVRTVTENDKGTKVSNSTEERDSDTIFPLQAALGYDLAQNLFVSKKNLLVEGSADLVALNLLSGTLKSVGREGLRDDVTIVPVGGADKVVTFISLLRGNSLDNVCLLDTIVDRSAQAKISDLIIQNIIRDKKVVFYHEFLERDYADLEDLFSLIDYLNLFNRAFSTTINEKDVDKDKPIIQQLNNILGKKRYNHYTPINYFARNISDIDFSDETLDNFEKVFVRINKLFSK